MAFWLIAENEVLAELDETNKLKTTPTDFRSIFELDWTYLNFSFKICNNRLNDFKSNKFKDWTIVDLHVPEVLVGGHPLTTKKAGPDFRYSEHPRVVSWVRAVWPALRAARATVCSAPANLIPDRPTFLAEAVRGATCAAADSSRWSTLASFQLLLPSLHRKSSEWPHWLLTTTCANATTCARQSCVGKVRDGRAAWNCRCRCGSAGKCILRGWLQHWVKMSVTF